MILLMPYACSDVIGGDMGQIKWSYCSCCPANWNSQSTSDPESPDPAKLREFADDLRDGKFSMPISQRVSLREAANAQAAAQAGGAGKIVLVM